jgi:hypothetical protein
MPLRRRSVLTLSALLLASGVSPALLAGASAEEDKVIATAVGDGDDSDYGDGGPADQADLNEPRMVAPDGKGGYYIADTYHHVIRHVDANNIISTYAGVVINGTSGGFRDGPADQALFDAPHSVDVLPNGDVIVGDPVNDRIRRIHEDPATGQRMVETIAGTGQSGYNGDGGPATAARLSDSKIAFDGPDGGIYIVDMGNDVIRRIDPVTKNIETWAGQKNVLGGPDGVDARQSGFSPRNIAFDIDGDLIVADRDANTIRSIDWETRIITTIAGNGETGAGGDGGPALQAQLNSPRGLGVDWMGNIYIADSENNKVRKVHIDTAAGEDKYGIITTVAGNGRSGGDGDNGPATEARISNPRHVIFNAAGDMFIAESGGHRVRVIRGMVPPAPTTTPTTTPATTPTTSPGTTPTTVQPGSVNPPSGRSGYWMLGADGALYPFGQAARHGDPMLALPAGAVSVDVEGTPTGQGYWVLDTTGRVYNFGDAEALGNVNRSILLAGETATSLSATPTGKGYWVFTTRGRALAFGDASHHGDTAAIRLNAPVLDSVATPSGKGYYMVAGDGGIFTFGDATFWGSMGGTKLNAPVQSLVPDGDGKGYWLVASDGGVFAFEAPFRGSLGAIRLNKPISGMVRQGNGYLMVAEDGGIFNFSDLPFSGSLGDNPPARPIVAVATLPR